MDLASFLAPASNDNTDLPQNSNDAPAAFPGQTVIMNRDKLPEAFESQEANVQREILADFFDLRDTAIRSGVQPHDNMLRLSPIKVDRLDEYEETINKGFWSGLVTGSGEAGCHDENHGDWHLFLGISIASLEFNQKFRSLFLQSKLPQGGVQEVFQDLQELYTSSGDSPTGGVEYFLQLSFVKELCRRIPAAVAAGFVAKHQKDNTLVVVLEGTHSWWDRPKNFSHALHGMVGTLPTSEEDAGNTNIGWFSDAYRKEARHLLDQLLEIDEFKTGMTPNSDTKLVVTGHSLGAGVGTLLVKMLQHEYEAKKVLIGGLMFAQPAAANTPIADPSILVFANLHDIVIKGANEHTIGTLIHLDVGGHVPEVSGLTRPGLTQTFDIAELAGNRHVQQWYLAAAFALYLNHFYPWQCKLCKVEKVAHNIKEGVKEAVRHLARKPRDSEHSEAKTEAGHVIHSAGKVASMRSQTCWPMCTSMSC